MNTNDIEKEIKQKPYWHVDAKWIFSLLFIFVFGLTLFTFGLFQLTNEKNGIETMTKIITLSFSREGVDSARDIEEFMQKIDAAPDKTIMPIPSLNITVSKAELEGKSPREMRYVIFRKIATPIYFNGKGAEEILNTPEARANFEKDTAMLRLVSEDSHKMLGNVLLFLAIASAISLGLVIYFSFGFGRVGNSGFIIVLATWFWAVLFTTLKYLTADVQAMKLPIPTDMGGNAGEAYGAMLAPLVREVLPDVMTIFSRIYIVAFFVGIGLITIALASKVATRFLSRT